MNVSSPRVFRHRRILRISLDAYDHAIRLLAAAVRRRFAPVSAVVGIANGGLAPAGGISAILDVPNHRITAKHNPTNAVYIKATGHVTVDLDDMAAALHRQQLAGTVLLVDDICGSGATFSTVRSAIDPYLQPDAVVRTVALCRNAGASLNPDLWAWTVDDWVHFPWEPPPQTTIAIEELPIPGKVEPA